MLADDIGKGGFESWENRLHSRLIVYYWHAIIHLVIWLIYQVMVICVWLWIILTSTFFSRENHFLLLWTFSLNVRCPYHRILCLLMYSPCLNLCGLLSFLVRFKKNVAIWWHDPLFSLIGSHLTLHCKEMIN